MEFKRDEELFDGLDGHTDTGRKTHAERYIGAIDRACDKVGEELEYSYKYKTVTEEYEKEMEALQRAVNRKLKKIFTEVNKWQEWDDLEEKPYIGRFADVNRPVFRTILGTHKLDYFGLMADRHLWLENFVEPLYFSKLRVEDMLDSLKFTKRNGIGAVIFAVLSALLFAVLKSKETWYDSPLLGLFITPLPFIAALCSLITLAAWLLGKVSCRKSERQKRYSEFVKEAELRIPRAHRTLRFYELWAKDQKQTIPEKLVEFRRFMEEAAALYDRAVGGQLP